MLRDIFLHLIQMMIAPLIFASIVQGIAGHGDLKHVGHIGVKALVYFEVLTGLALVVGLTVVNLRPARRGRAPERRHQPARARWPQAGR